MRIVVWRVFIVCVGSTISLHRATFLVLKILSILYQMFKAEIPSFYAIQKLVSQTFLTHQHAEVPPRVAGCRTCLAPDRGGQCYSPGPQHLACSPQSTVL